MLTSGIKGDLPISSLVCHLREELYSMIFAQFMIFCKSPSRRRIRVAFGASCTPAPTSSNLRARSRMTTSWPARFRPSTCQITFNDGLMSRSIPQAAVRPAMPAPTMITRNVFRGEKIHSESSSEHSMVYFTIKEEKGNTEEILQGFQMLFLIEVMARK